MLNLALHIEYLLLRHDCVTIPGFGAFINVRKAASFDNRTGMFSPMRREVRFNPAVSFDDGLLASSFARKHSIPFEQGRELLFKEIESLKSALDADREVTMGRLGIISLDNENKLNFHPFSDPSGVMDNLGLTDVPVRKTVKENLHEGDKVSAETVETAPMPDRDTESGYNERAWRDNDRYYYIPVHKTFAKVAASLVIVLAVALSILLPSSVNNQNIDKASVVPLIDTATPEKIVVKQEDALNDEPATTSINVATPEISAVGSEESVQNEKRYYLIIATFRSEAEAKTYISIHNNDSFDLEAVKSHKVCRVAAKSSVSKSELLELMRSENFKMKYPQAWIWNE